MHPKSPDPQNRSRAARDWLPLLVVSGAAVVASSGCLGPPIDVTAAFQVSEVTTGWLDAGLIEGNRNKLVPTISFRLENASAGEIRSIQVNGVFRRIGEPEEWGNAFVRAIDSDGLAAGSATSPIVLRSSLGYTGEQPRIEMFEHQDFKDVKVELFLKHGGQQWVKLNEYEIDRQLLTQ